MTAAQQLHIVLSLRHVRHVAPAHLEMKTQVKHGHIHHIDACAGSGTRRIHIAASASACVPVPVSVSSKVIWSFGKALSYVPQWPTFHLTSSVRPQQYQYHSAFERAISYCAAFTSSCELISLIIEQSAGAAVRAGHQGIVSAPIVREGTRSPLFQPTGLLVSRSFMCTERLV